MAHYENLPIYKKTLELAVYIENIVRGFSRYHKYTIGSDMRNLSREVVRLIIKTNSEKDKLVTLTTLRDTIEEFKDKTYKPSRSVCFIVERPKKRLYYIHMDIKNFFMTIDKNILYKILERKVKDEALLWLAHVIIFHNPTEKCINKGKRHLIKYLPPHKSLFNAPEDRGLPIGNLTSQFFANTYLNELDQYVKHTLKCRFYVRYCDDFLILDKSPERLEGVREKIDEFVNKKLNLSINERHCKVFPVSNGIDFLGYIIRQDYMLVRRRVVNNLKSKLNWFEKRLKGGRVGGDIRIVRYDYPLMEKLRSMIASYLGHLKWADTYRLRSSILERYSFLKEYFSFEEKDGFVVSKPKGLPYSRAGLLALQSLHKYCQIFPSIKSQYLYYANRFRGMCIFFQVGCFYEFYTELQEDVINTIGLKRCKEGKRAVKYGFPVRLEGEYKKRLLEKGIPVVIVRETDRYIGRIKERLPVIKITGG